MTIFAVRCCLHSMHVHHHSDACCYCDSCHRHQNCCGLVVAVSRVCVTTKTTTAAAAAAATTTTTAKKVKKKKSKLCVCSIQKMHSGASKFIYMTAQTNRMTCICVVTQRDLDAGITVCWPTNQHLEVFCVLHFDIVHFFFFQFSRFTSFQFYNFQWSGFFLDVQTLV